MWQHSTELTKASRWSILGLSNKTQLCRARVGAGGTFCLEPEPAGYFMPSRGPIQRWDIVPGTGVRADQNFAVFASMPGMWSRSRGRRTLPGTRIAAARTSYPEPDPQPQRIFSRTPKSKSEPELPKILDLVPAGRYKI